MAASHSSSSSPSAVTQYVQYSQHMWGKFVKYAFIATAFAIAILIIMALTLL